MLIHSELDIHSLILLNFLVTVKAAPHKCVDRTGLLWTWVKAENEV